MTTYLHASSLAKLGGLFFTRQTAYPAAPRHKPLLAYVAAWRRQRKAIAELARLSDRELADIGLTRAEIAQAVRR